MCVSINISAQIYLYKYKYTYVCLFVCDMVHSYVRYIAHRHVWHDSFKSNLDNGSAWRHCKGASRACSCICDMTHSYGRHDSFMRLTWLIHMCDMTHSNVWHDPSIHVTGLIHMCDMTHSYVWHDSLILWHDPFMCHDWHICEMTHLEPGCTKNPTGIWTCVQFHCLGDFPL